MKHIGLFEGIGGFSLAARWMGWETVAWCEIDPFCQKVLKHHFPEATGHTDIKQTDFTQYANKIGLLTGGFPCQPYSLAGKRKGKEDDRHLWPEMLRAIREIKPRWVVGENVYGLVNWNGGVVFDEVQSDLEAEGYEVWSVILPAAAVNAPHRRDRIWIIAYSKENGCDKRGTGTNEREEYKLCNRDKIWNIIATDGTESNATDTTITGNNKRFCGKEGTATDTTSTGRGENNGQGKSEQPNENEPGGYWQNFPTEPPICGGDDGISRELDGITFPKWRNESIKAYGNAIVPQVAYEIIKVIQQIEETK